MLDIPSYGNLGLGNVSHPKIESLIARQSLFDALYRLNPEVVDELLESAVPLFVAARNESYLGERSDYIHTIAIFREPGSYGERAVHVSSWAELEEAAVIPHVSDVWSKLGSQVAQNFWSLFQEGALDHDGEGILGTELKKLHSVIREWLRRCHLNEDWIGEAILLNVLSASSGKNAGRFTFHYPISWGYASSGDGKLSFFMGGPREPDVSFRLPDEAVQLLKPTLSIPLWNPVVETWETYKEQVLKSLNADLAKYKASQEARFGLLGFSPTKATRERSGPTNVPYDWLVRHQVEGKSAREIVDIHAAEYPDKIVSESAVRKKLNELAKILPLALRK
jgi:hypothetical protein